MPPKKTTAAPLTDTLPSTTLIPNSALLRRFLSRLPKPVLIDLVLIWLDHPLCPVQEPVDEEEDYFMQEDETTEEKKALYETYRGDSNISKKIVIERILGHDWVRTTTRKILITETRIKCPSSRDVRHATSVPSTCCSKVGLL
jgi:Kinetochore protein CHL4 like